MSHTWALPCWLSDSDHRTLFCSQNLLRTHTTCFPISSVVSRHYRMDEFDGPMTILWGFENITRTKSSIPLHNYWSIFVSSAQFLCIISCQILPNFSWHSCSYLDKFQASFFYLVCLKISKLGYWYFIYFSYLIHKTFDYDT